MMLDKKTTRQIRQDYIKTNEPILDILFPNKVWVSQESLIDLIETFGAQEKSLFDLYDYIKKNEKD